MKPEEFVQIAEDRIAQEKAEREGRESERSTQARRWAAEILEQVVKDYPCLEGLTMSVDGFFIIISAPGYRKIRVTFDACALFKNSYPLGLDPCVRNITIAYILPEGEEWTFAENCRINDLKSPLVDRLGFAFMASARPAEYMQRSE